MKIKKIQILQPIMFGIKFMLPCVVAGGILIAISFMIDNPELGMDSYGKNTISASFFNSTGSAIFGLMLPVLCAGISFFFSKQAGIPAGLASGYLASTGSSGFLGALIMGFVTGYFVKFLVAKFNQIPESLSGARDLLLIPLLSVLISGVFINWLIEPVIGYINLTITSYLQSMNGSENIILGIITAGMQGIDMGGPINKTSYLFATGALSSGVYNIMSAVLAGGIVPPFATALASTLFKSKFTEEERKQGFTNYIVGLAGITEGAIPFLLREPWKVITSCVIGCSIAGGLSMYLDCSIRAPFGGFFVAPLNTNFGGWIFSVCVGITVGAIILGLIKKKVA